MRTTTTRRCAAGIALLALAGCGSAATSSQGATSHPAAGTGAAAAATTPTVAVASLAGLGEVLVAGSNGMTLYQFDKDVAGSGSSACTGGCLATWPALTLPTGASPTAAPGISGQWGTITRPDGTATQVTFDGRPLYFFSGDTKRGDANGNYPHWSVVPAHGGAAPSASAASSGGGGYAYP